ncbi:hypothetical protein MC885_003514 [Smutsia gigantea]|nr:hypothetical protein MC885_003514 [Smutsia gigantea]
MVGPGNPQQDQKVEKEVGWQDLGTGAGPQRGYLVVAWAQDWQGVGVHSGKEKPKSSLRTGARIPEAPAKPEEAEAEPFTDSSLFAHWGQELSPEGRRAALKQFQYYGYNAYLSDRLPLDRPLPDLRPSGCRNLSFPDSLPEVSIVFIFVNEALSVLLRSIHSAIERTPPHLLKEIILVDDNSSTGECPHPCAQHAAPCLTAEQRALPLLQVLVTLGSPWRPLPGDVASLMRDLWWSLFWKIHSVGVPSPRPRGAWSPSPSLLADHSQRPRPSAV